MSLSTTYTGAARGATCIPDTSCLAPPGVSGVPTTEIAEPPPRIAYAPRIELRRQADRLIEAALRLGRDADLLAEAQRVNAAATRAHHGAPAAPPPPPRPSSWPRRLARVLGVL